MKNIFLVDADDTILDFQGASISAVRNAFFVFGKEWKEEYATVYKRVNDNLWEALERREITREQLLKTRFSLYLRELGLADIDGDKFNELYLTHLATKPLYVKGAKAFLEKLKGLGRVYIVTNGTEKIQKSRFSILGIDDLIDGVFISQTIGYDKPAKEYTDYVIKHVDGFTKENAVWIGDSLSADIKSANEAGITSIWFNYYKKPASAHVKPDYIVDNFDKIFKILQNIEEKA